MIFVNDAFSFFFLYGCRYTFHASLRDATKCCESPTIIVINPFQFWNLNRSYTRVRVTREERKKERIAEFHFLFCLPHWSQYTEQSSWLLEAQRKYKYPSPCAPSSTESLFFFETCVHTRFTWTVISVMRGDVSGFPKWFASNSFIDINRSSLWSKSVSCLANSTGSKSNTKKMGLQIWKRNTIQDFVAELGGFRNFLTIFFYFQSFDFFGPSNIRRLQSMLDNRSQN